jgi:predicted acyltransferase
LCGEKLDLIERNSLSDGMSETNAPSTTSLTSRLTSLDALRGFDMLWIMGGDSIGHALAHMEGADSGVMKVVANQLDHVAWEGFRFYDLIFPMFVFIVGVSLVYSLTKTVEQAGRKAAMMRVIRRGLLLWLIGIIYYGGWSKGIYNAEANEGIRLMGVLQRIGLCYLFAGLLFLYLKPKGLVIALASLLLGYWALLTFVAAPGQAAVSFEEGKNFTNWFDSQYLPFFKWDGPHDPEGVLSTLPAISTCLFGVLAGLLLRSTNITSIRKTTWLAGAGIAAVAIGYLWGLQFPIIKKLWTSSFVLVAAGYSAILLAAFHWIIDIKGHQKWALPFIWIGLNPITIYLLGNLINFDDLAARVLGGPVSAWADGIAHGLGAVLIAIGGMLLGLLVAWFLHRKKLYLRL